MKKMLLFTLLYNAISWANGQGIGIGTNSPHPSAILNLESNSKGFLLPSMGTSDRLAISSPAFGLMLYDFNTKSIWMNGTSGWQELTTDVTNPWLKSAFDIYRSTGNVGIGVEFPMNKLHIHSSLSTENLLRITNSSSGIAATDGVTMGLSANNARLINSENGPLSLGTNNSDMLSIHNNGRAGLGTGLSVPAAKLQVNGSSSVTQPSLLITDSAASVGGILKFRNLNNTTGISFAEFSGSSYNSSQYLDIVSDSANIATFRGNGNMGIRNLSPVYPLDVIGDFNTTGALRINSNSGSAGQVLTSNGNAAPSWQAAAYSNNIRFSFNTTFFGAITRQDDSMNLNYATAYYNLNTAAVASVPGNSTRLQFNQSGLYHFEGTMYLETSVSPALNYRPVAIISFWINNQKFDVESSELINANAALPTTQFNKHVKYQFEVFITAGQTLKISSFFNGISGNFFRLGNLRGHLVSD